MKKVLLIHNKYRNTGGEDTAVLQEIRLLKEKYTIILLYCPKNSTHLLVTYDKKVFKS